MSLKKIWSSPFVFQAVILNLQVQLSTLPKYLLFCMTRTAHNISKTIKCRVCIQPNTIIHWISDSTLHPVSTDSWAKFSAKLLYPIQLQIVIHKERVPE